MYHVLARAEAGATWNEFVDNHEDGWFWHRQEWIDYCLAKNGGRDASVMIIHLATRRVLALVPVIEEGDRLGMGGDDLPWPLIELEGVHSETVSELVAMVGQYLKRRSLKLGQREVIIRKAGVLDYREAMTRLTAMEFKEEGRLQVDNVSWQTRILDLSQFEKTNMQTVRKSYKQLIRRGQENRQLRIGGDWAFDLYREVHQLTYGHPRPPKTYDCMGEWSRGGQAVAAGVAHEDQAAVMLWIVYKRKAYYASGAARGDQALMHPLMWGSLAHLKEIGCLRVELGFQGHAKTEKEAHIEFFKRGFGGEDWPVPAMRMTFCDVAMASA